jgi:hypothetical protein
MQLLKNLHRLIDLFYILKYKLIYKIKVVKKNEGLIQFSNGWIIARSGWKDRFSFDDMAGLQDELSNPSR